MQNKLRLIRAGVLTLEDVLPLIPEEEDKFFDSVDFFGYRVGVNSVRLKTFKIKGIACVTCGIIGEFFAVERDKGLFGKYHLNLYAMKDGKEILMTRDHIFPRSKGGSNALCNMQPMCQPCNSKKGDKC